MANPPPPYDNITGISRAAMKDNAQITLAEYDGNARPGELVVDQITSVLYVGNALGNLTLLAPPAGVTTWALLGDKVGAAGPAAIALGQNAGLDGQANAAIALGQYAGQGGQGGAAISIGLNAGGNTFQGEYAVAVGSSAGYDAQGNAAVAVGAGAGATLQGLHAVAIGTDAGATSQANRAVAIGYLAGSTAQGNSAVAIGYYAGELNQGNNSIIINATGTDLQQTTANTFTVAPIRNDVANVAQIMFYNTASKEITYGNTISVAGNVTTGNLIQNGVSVSPPNFVSISGTGAVNLSTTTSVNILFITSAGFTVTLNAPASPVNGQQCSFSVINNTVTLAVGSGTFVPTFAGALTDGLSYRYTYYSANNSWYRF